MVATKTTPKPKPRPKPKPKVVPAHPAQDKLTPAELKQKYGWVLALLDTDKTLHTLFTTAVNAGWTDARFTAALRNTKWYKGHTETYRNAEIQRTTDPATWNNRVAQQRADIAAAAVKMGVAGLTGAQSLQLATDSLRFGWTPQQLQTTLSGYVNVGTDTAPVHPGGDSGQAYDEVKKLAADYLIPYSDTQAAKDAVAIASGRLSMEAKKAEFIGHAKANWGFMSGALDAGQTVAGYVDPYRQLAATTLGTVPDAVDWTQPKWSSLFSAVDPKTGQAAPLSLADATKKIKNDPVYGYDQSQPGQTERSSFGHSMLNLFGFSPGGG